MNREKKFYDNGTVSYKELLENTMLPVTAAFEAYKDKPERIFLEGMVGDKWVEDSVSVERQTFAPFTDAEGAVFIMDERGLKKLIQAPDVFYYRIPEDTQDIAETAFTECPTLEILDVPYRISQDHVENALEWHEEEVRINLFDWTYDCKLSAELISEIANGWTDDFGFVYSRDRKRLLKAASVKEEYFIPEGVEKIERLAFVGTTFETLNIPYTCNLNDLPEEECPIFGSDRVAGTVIPWCMPYHHTAYELEGPFAEIDRNYLKLDIDNLDSRIMSDIQQDENDPFGDDTYLYHIQFYCERDKNSEDPKFWIIKPSNRHMGYAVSIHLYGGKAETHYDAHVVFVTSDLSSLKNRTAELMLIRNIKQELSTGTLLTLKAADPATSSSPSNESILKSAGFVKLPQGWTDEKGQAYEVYLYGSQKPESLPLIMERIEQLGNGLIYCKDYDILPEQYPYEIEADGAQYRIRDGIKILEEAPNVPYYRISEDVLEIAEYAFELCPLLREIDVPYCISDYNIQKALDHSHYPIKCHKWDWPYDCTISAELEAEIADGITDEYGYVYSLDRKRLLKAAPEVGEYWIPETVEKIERLAFVQCHYETLHIPYTCHLFDLPAEEWPVFGREDNQGCEVIWDRPYAEQDLVADSLYVSDDDHVVDEYGVVYTKNMKRLLHARSLYDSPTTPIVHMTDYTVPDGVETICSQSFIICKEHLTLHLPHSIKVIGDSLFGEEGGEILFK